MIVVIGYMNKKVHTSKAHALAQKLVKELDIYETKKFTVTIDSESERWITIIVEDNKYLVLSILNQIQEIVVKNGGYHMTCISINGENKLEILINTY